MLRRTPRRSNWWTLSFDSQVWYSLSFIFRKFYIFCFKVCLRHRVMVIEQLFYSSSYSQELPSFGDETLVLIVFVSIEWEQVAKQSIYWSYLCLLHRLLCGFLCCLFFRIYVFLEWFLQENSLLDVIEGGQPRFPSSRDNPVQWLQCLSKGM